MALDPESPTPAEAAAEIAEVGSVVLRRAWDRELLARLRQAILDFAGGRNDKTAVAEPKFQRYMAHGAGTYAWLWREGLVDGHFLRAMFVGSLYHRLCEIALDDSELYAIPTRLGFRLHDPARTDLSFVPYHQDSYGQDARLSRMMNCWIPLDPGCGRDAPGLEVLRHLARPNYPTAAASGQTRSGLYDGMVIDREALVADYGERFLAPEFEVGDGFVFTEQTIHRTYVTPQMTRPRTNFEFRVYSMKHLRPGADGAALRQISLRLA